MGNSTLKKCPFCAEDIKEEAIKCRFCGSELSERKDISLDLGTDAARAVNKALKQKELHDFAFTFFAVLLFLTAAGLGFFLKSFLVGIGIFFLGIPFVAKWYYKE